MTKKASYNLNVFEGKEAFLGVIMLVGVVFFFFNKKDVKTLHMDNDKFLYKIT